MRAQRTLEPLRNRAYNPAMKHALTAALLLALSCGLGFGCGSKDKDAGPSLDMTSDSAVCKKAMACCKERVKLETGGLKADDLNLKCSGVALADTDEACTQFMQGYAMSFTEKKAEVPAVCK